MKRREAWWLHAVMHATLVVGVAFALYPVLWVVALALGSHSTPAPRAMRCIVALRPIR